MTGGSDSDPTFASDSFRLREVVQPVACAQAWHRDDVTADNWTVPLTVAALKELDELARRLDGLGGAIEDLRPENYELQASAEVMDAVRLKLHEGVGFAVLDRLPVECWGERGAKAVAWLLANLLGPVVMQKVDGTRLYEVRDLGKKLGYGVRRSITSLEQDFHTDGGWLVETPEIVTLACLRPASSGGLSRVVSLVTAHNRMSESHPEQLARLYRSFLWDRQAEHPPGEAKSSRQPVFSFNDGKLVARHYVDYIVNGHQLLGIPLDEDGRAALDTLKSILDASENQIEFRLERGQIEFVNNQLVAHARTAFRDDEADGGRHLLRLWNRRAGGIALEETPEAAE